MQYETPETESGWCRERRGTYGEHWVQETALARETAPGGQRSQTVAAAEGWARPGSQVAHADEALALL